MIEDLNSTTGLALSVCGLLAFVAGWLRWIRPRYRKTRQDGVAIRDAILGRDAIVDSITGKELAPPLPGIGQRMATVEQALVVFAQNQHDLDELKGWRETVDADIADLKEQRMERIITRAESAAAFRAMEAAHNAEAPLDVDSDDS